MSDYAAGIDAMLETVLRSASGGVDLDRAGVAIDEGLRALAKQAVALGAAEYGTHEALARCKKCKTTRMHTVQALAPDVVARAASHTAKVVDGIVRLTAFAKGQPDSRPDLGGDWLRALTDEQVRTVMGWVEAAQGDK